MASARDKLYCYVDETGQDAASAFFIVVAVVTAQEQERLRCKLEEIERAAGTGQRKWHKSRSERRLRYLELLLESDFLTDEIFYTSYPKPTSYFSPIVETVKMAIMSKSTPGCIARVSVDGIDRKKAAELTNALRNRGLSVQMVRSARDESEPLIRLADMWAGCIRAAHSGSGPESEMLKRAYAIKRITNLKA